jgi:hypothetical protein
LINSQPTGERIPLIVILLVLPPFDDLTAKNFNQKYLQKDKNPKPKVDYSSVGKSNLQTQSPVTYNTQASTKNKNEGRESPKNTGNKGKTFGTEPSKTGTRTPVKDTKQDQKPFTNINKPQPDISFEIKPNEVAKNSKKSDIIGLLQNLDSRSSANGQIFQSKIKESIKPIIPENGQNSDFKKKSAIGNNIINELANEIQSKNGKPQASKQLTTPETVMSTNKEVKSNDKDFAKTTGKSEDLIQLKIEELKKKPQSSLTVQDREILKLMAKKK